MGVVNNSSNSSYNFIPSSNSSSYFDNNVPLKKVNVTGNFVDCIGLVSVEQHYQNNYSQKIEASYMFALDTSSEVVSFYVLINNKKMHGQIQERSQAQQTYNAGVSDNKKSSLLKKLNNSTYSMSLGNIEPGEIIVVSFSYLTQTINNSEGFKFVLPTNIAPKYSGSSFSADSYRRRSLPYGRCLNGLLRFFGWLKPG